MGQVWERLGRWVRSASDRQRGAGVSHITLLLVVSAAFTLLYNLTFWHKVLGAYPLSWGNLGFLLSIAFCLFGVTALLLSLFDLPYVFKPALIVWTLSAATVAYFMDAYQVIVDDAMLQNALLTDSKEAGDLFTPRFFAYVLLLGVLPAFFIARTAVRRAPTWRVGLLRRVKTVGLLVAGIALALFVFNKDWASFLRVHKPTRRYANPDYLAYSLVKFTAQRSALPRGPIKPLGLDARTPSWDKKRELIIMVVGESARADRFSLNGYARETNPRLAKSGAISFSDMRSNGTSTANSVPCMFSTLDYRTYSDRKARSSENLLDVLRHAGVNVLWRDNNSDSKGVADRVPYENFKTVDRNPAVEGEPRDEGMLAGLQGYIDSQKKGDIFIVLHQMGNHGPAYYKRYPAAFERFKPVRKTTELGECTSQEIDNAYDNAILYTDHFLGEVIDLLRTNSDRFEAAMLYSSDHGESLGEKGLYLHGMPYSIAPDVQKQVATVFWFSDSFKIDTNRFRKAKDMKLSHSNLFHTVLGLMEIESSVYDPTMDIARLVDPSSPLLAEHQPPKTVNVN